MYRKEDAPEQSVVLLVISKVAASIQISLALVVVADKELENPTVPVTERVRHGEEEATPTFPFAFTLNIELVAYAAEVDEAMSKRGV